MNKSNSDLGLFFRAAFSIDLTIFALKDEKLQVLLIKRKESPFAGHLALPGRLVHPDNRPGDEAAALAKHFIKTSDFYCRQIQAFTDLDRHPVGRVITIGHLVLIPFAEFQFFPNDLAGHALWIPVEAVPKMPFDHNLVVETGLEKLRQDIRHYPIAFHLLPELFSIPELHRVYEAVLATKIDIRNFARKVKGSPLIQATDTFKPKRFPAGRRARLHRFLKSEYESRTEAPLHMQF